MAKIVDFTSIFYDNSIIAITKKENNSVIAITKKENNSVIAIIKKRIIG